jgi:ribosomal protein S12 methylthiotransferase accessory factor YcaO
MSDVWPLRHLREAVRECDDMLSDILAEVTMLQAASGGDYPPEAAVLLANVMTLREVLTDGFPPALQQAMAAEQTVYEAEGARGEPPDEPALGRHRVPPRRRAPAHARCIKC